MCTKWKPSIFPRVQYLLCNWLNYRSHALHLINHSLLKQSLIESLIELHCILAHGALLSTGWINTSIPCIVLSDGKLACVLGRDGHWQFRGQAVIQPDSEKRPYVRHLEEKNPEPKWLMVVLVWLAGTHGLIMVPKMMTSHLKQLRSDIAGISGGLQYVTYRIRLA